MFLAFRAMGALEREKKQTHKQKARRFLGGLSFACKLLDFIGYPSAKRLRMKFSQSENFKTSQNPSR